jgi:alpha-amylase
MPHALHALKKAMLGFAVGAAAALATLVVPVTPTHAQTTNRTAFVHLFEWKWTDVAKECEDFLGPKGFAAVQVSPPNEHNWVATGDGAPYPWWMRYQPVGYSLDRSRSGTRAEFQDMVNRCNTKGVGIYVDAVFNHMSGGTSGTSSAGNSWTYHNYPRVPFGATDFHSPACGITNYQDANNVQSCELSGLQDLNTDSNYVRGRISDYLVDLANIGVKGFRVDAAKHISPADLGAIIDNVNSRVTNRPYWFLEVIGAPGEAVQPNQYFGLNGNLVNVTEFAYGPKLHEKFAGGGKLADLQTFGATWGLLASDRAVAFTDNHDKQRGHGGGGNYLTYHYGATYDLANIFMLAWPYGYPALMSSYAFKKDTDFDTSYGPPYNTGGATKGPWDGGVAQPACFNQAVGGWVCEHRYRPIANMVGFRNATIGNFFVSNWWSNGNNQIAFGRGNLGFVAINKEATTLSRTFATSLPAGRYCDVIGGEFNAAAGTCSGDVYTVDGAGNVALTVEAYKAVALHAGAKLGNAATPTVNIAFKVQGADPAAGQLVAVVGNVAALGAWNVCNAVPLNPDGGAHSGMVSLPVSTAVQFKYVKYQNCATPTWEGGANRALTTPASGTGSTCGVFGSAAACSTASVGSATVTFNVVASTIMGQSIALVGSGSQFGAWAPASALAMSVVPGTGSGQSNTWRVSSSLPADVTIEYKYVKKGPNGDVIWESGGNRIVNTPASGQSATRNETWK